MIDQFVDVARREVHRYLRMRRVIRDWGHEAKVGPGWRVLGSGFYGVALAHEDFPGLVLKISGPAGFGYGDRSSVYEAREQRDGSDRYDPWQVFARHAQAHPHKHLPKIMHFEQVRQSIAFAVMPRYAPCTEIDGHAPMVCKWRKQLRGELACGTRTSWMWPIRQMACGLGFRVDLHDDNVMYDPRIDEFVMTDPFSDVSELLRMLP